MTIDQGATTDPIVRINELENLRTKNMSSLTLTLAFIALIYAIAIRLYPVTRENSFWFELSHILVVAAVSLLISSVFLRYRYLTNVSDNRHSFIDRVKHLEQHATNHNINMFTIILSVSISILIGIGLVYVYQLDRSSWLYVIYNVFICVIVLLLVASRYIYHNVSSVRSVANAESALVNRIRQLEQLRINFITLFLLFSFCICAILIRTYKEPNGSTVWQTVSGMLISISVSLLVISILQFIRDKRFMSTINDAIADQISSKVEKAIGKIREVKHSVLPINIYWSKDENLLDDQIRCFSKSSKIRFMSTSAKGLLERALSQIKPTVYVELELLLMNPKSQKLLNYRSEQLRRHRELKEPAELKKEIISCVIKAYLLYKHSHRFTSIKIRFHDEVPFSRIEFADSVLYLSYYESQRDVNVLGPVSQYPSDNDIYSAYDRYFDNVWQSSTHTSFCFDSIGCDNDFKTSLKFCFTDFEHDIDALFNAISNEYVPELRDVREHQKNVSRAI